MNMALRRLGNEVPISSIFEGSKASRAGLEVYGQTRDDLLCERDWEFARRDVAASTNGQTAIAPWLYEYAWPSDCLKLRYIMPAAPGTFPVYDPRPQQFTWFNDQRLGTPARAILANISPATLIYTGQITDPSTWLPDFVEALVEGLARRLAVAITGSADVLKAETELAAQAIEPPAGPGKAPASNVVQWRQH